jgi:pimeloyl-ACP methyl ester carboxylesterase
MLKYTSWFLTWDNEIMITQTLLVPTNGIRLHVEASGPEDGPLVVLLHGFPEYWGGLAKQMEPLAKADFRVIAPDQRGYNLSDKPRGVNAYRISQLAGDVIGLIDYFGREKAVVIGHDWGAAVAWHVAIHAPEHVERLAILNVPHPASMARALTTFSRQILRSWYIYFFQIPALPELLLRAGNFAALRRMLQASAAPGVFSKEDMRCYTAAWSQPGALTAMINWYRAAARTALKQGLREMNSAADQHVRMPTLILWGEKDVALIPEMAAWSLEWCDQGELVRFPGVSHWVQHEKANEVTQRLIEFLR